MKKSLLILLLIVGFIGFSQEKYKPNSFETDNFIEDVYGKLDKNSQLYKNLKDLLLNRVEFKISPKIKGEKDYENIADFPLFNKYNSNLKRDSELNPDTFNPIKYNLTFYHHYTKVYRFENSDWLLIIYPQNTAK